ncbi:MAG: DegV family protein, partial [Candidatus Eremiobacteraeota bacterium]|nr:DegV family protein [Candidatus Eremiobacteraeota bacterium]
MVRIVTDSTCDLPLSDLEERGITLVPLSVRFGARSYRDGLDIGHGEFYRMMADHSELPTTSQPAPGDFLEIYRRLAGEGASILSIHLSSRLSGTVNSARMARDLLMEDEPGASVTVIDSLTATLGLGMMVLKAHALAGQGMPVEHIAADLNSMAPRNHGVGLVKDLHHLSRGGRLSGSQAFFGSLLKVVPLIKMEQGVLEPLGKAVGVQAGLKKIGEYIQQKGSGSPPPSLALVTGELIEERDRLAEMLQAGHPRSPIMKGTLGAVIGAHLGP